MRQAWFPLRTNVAFFETTGPAPSIEGRVKEMCLLADELVFEPGSFDVSVGEDGSFSSWTPLDMLNEAELRRRRHAVERGQTMTLAVGAQEDVGVPATEMHAILVTPLERAFSAEFHLLANDSGLIREPWVRWALPTPEASVEIAAASRDLQNDLRGAPTVAGGEPLNMCVRGQLAHDVALSGVLGVRIIVDSLHQPLLTHLAAEGDAVREAQVPGSVALPLWAPSVVDVPWPDIIALHDHDAIGEFRAKLEQAEAAVASIDDVTERALALTQLGLDEAVREVGRRAPTLGGVVADVAAGSVLDLMPFGGTIYSAARGVGAVRRAQASWHAVLLKLRR